MQKTMTISNYFYLDLLNNNISIKLNTIRYKIGYAPQVSSLFIRPLFFVVTMLRICETLHIRGQNDFCLLFPSNLDYILTNLSS